MTRKIEKQKKKPTKMNDRQKVEGEDVQKLREENEELDAKRQNLSRITRRKGI
jgi:hypothetical protein